MFSKTSEIVTYSMFYPACVFQS